jgi:chromosome segregation ATPase
MSNYQGLEKLISRFSRKWADKKRLARVKTADVTTNLKTILDYGHYMVSKLNNALIENMKCYSRIEGTIQTTNERLEQHQPEYEQWQEKREKLERQIKELEEKMNQAGPDEYAKLEGEKSQLDKEFHEAQTTENYHFTIVDKAKKALPVQRTHLTSYKDMIDSLKQFKTGLEQDLDHVTQVYLSAPTAIKTALSVKAASQYDKGMKYATDKATDAVLKSVEGILDETASRAERPLIEDEKLQAYRKVQQEMRAHYDKRVDQLKKTYAEPGRRVD